MAFTIVGKIGPEIEHFPFTYPQLQFHLCRAENSGGFSEQTGHLQVQFSPDLSLTPLRKVKTWDNRPVNISCIADAIPNATIKWYKHGMEIIRNDIYRIENTG